MEVPAALPKSYGGVDVKSGRGPGSEEDRRVNLLICAMKREPLAFGMGFLDNDPLKKNRALFRKQTSFLACCQKQMPAAAATLEQSQPSRPRAKIPPARGALAGEKPARRRSSPQSETALQKKIGQQPARDGSRRRRQHSTKQIRLERLCGFRIHPTCREGP